MSPCGWRFPYIVMELMVLCVLVALWVALYPPRERERPMPPYLATEREVEALFTTDAGVGDLALSTVEPHQAVIHPILSLGRPMPSKPFPNQRRPPCMRGEREIHGACWIGPIGGEKPPCGDKLFDYRGECYFASYEAPKQPTSKEP